MSILDAIRLSDFILTLVCEVRYLMLDYSH